MSSSIVSGSNKTDGRPQRILLTGGRAPATLELARLLARSGHHVFVAESFPSHVCRYSKAVARSFATPEPTEDLEGFLLALIDVIETQRIDLLVPTCEEVFHIACHHRRLSRHCRVFCEEIAVLQRLHNKHALNELIRSLGLPAPRTLLLSSNDPHTVLADWLNSNMLKAFVVKPAYGRFGTDVHRFRDGLTPKSRLPDLGDRLWIAQEFISGTAFCTYSVADRGELTAHSTYPVRFTAGGSAITFQSVQHREIERWIAAFLNNLNYTGQIGFDFIQDTDGRLLPLDCNPRVTSGIHLFDNATSFVDAFRGTGHPTKYPDSERVRCIRAAVPLFGLSNIRSWADARLWLRTAFFGQDVVFRWRDPLPALHQFVALARFAWRSRVHRCSLIEETTRDIQWNGDQQR